MLDISGGDSAVLAGIRATQQMLVEQATPDLSALARLAVHRDHLSDRNTHIPTDLPTVWARLGNPLRAEAIARPITDPHRQAAALAGLVQVLLDAGDIDSAESVGLAVQPADRRAQVLTTVAVALAEDPHRARSIIRAIAGPRRQESAQGALAAATADIGDFDSVEAVARTMTDPDLREGALYAIVRLRSSPEASQSQTSKAKHWCGSSRSSPKPITSTGLNTSPARSPTGTRSHRH